MSSMSATTASRMLRRAAESAGIPLGTGPLPLPLEALDLKARRDRARLDTMIRYAFSRGCRTRFVFDYFAGGATGGAAPRCGTCDVCLGWRQGTTRPLDDAELLRVRIALSAVGRLSGRFGVERVAQVLVGSRVRVVLDRGLDKIPTYGKLAAVPLDDVKDLLGVLADVGLIERQGIDGGRPGAFVLALSPDGFAVARGQLRPELALPSPGGARSTSRRPAKPSDGAAGAAPAAADVDPELLAKLKGWRTEEARRQGMPPYIIFPDRTLVALAAAQPRSREALLQVRGIGPAKLEAYGERLLQLLS